MNLHWKLPLRMDAMASYIYDADGHMVLQIRGWGHLTGVGGLRLSAEDAEAVQRARGEAIVAAVNAACGAGQKTPDGQDGPEQMTDIYGVACDVHLVRTFRDGRQMGAGYDLDKPSTWFVYDSESERAKWHKHCGPYSTFEQAVDWINGIREER